MLALDHRQTELCLTDWLGCISKTAPGAGQRPIKETGNVFMVDHSELNAGGGMRLDIDQLLDNHRSEISDLRARTSDLLSRNPSFYDDIFLLRYILTHSKKGGIEVAADAVRKTIAWRTENEVVLEKIALTGEAPHKDIMLRFNTAGHACDLGGYEPVWVVRTGHSNQRAMMSTLSIDQVKDWLHYSKEVFFRLCDERTRKTRKLVKVIA